MFGAPRPAQPPNPQTGMVDPYLNEVVTHVAEVDEDAIRRQNRIAILPFFIIAIVIPFFWVMGCIVWFCNEYRTTSEIRGTQVYLTEHTLVYTMGNLPIECNRVTIPLANIASVIVQPGIMTVNIKPTAPEVMLNREYAVATRSVPICHVYNAEEFAEVIQSKLH